MKPRIEKIDDYWLITWTEEYSGVRSKRTERMWSFQGALEYLADRYKYSSTLRKEAWIGKA